MNTDDFVYSQSKSGISDALRKDIRLLMTLLAEIIKEQEGEKLLLKIDEIRTLAKDIRKNPSPDLIEQQKKIIRGLDYEQARKIARAFTIYFQLVNIAEEAQRVRRIRDYEKDVKSPLGMSLRGLFHDLKSEGHGASSVAKFMSTMKIELILTAHPTEAKRRTVLDHLLRINSHLAKLNHEDLTVYESEKEILGIKETLEILWQTAEIRQRKVDVMDEVDQTLFFFQRTLINTLSDLHEKIEAEYERVYDGAKHFPARPMVSFGSWVGADRDGNPFVTAAVTAKTVHIQQKLIIEHYKEEVVNLLRRFSQSLTRTPVSKALLSSIEENEKQMPHLAKELKRYESSEIYRSKLSFMYERLQNVFNKKKKGYQSADQFVTDLRLISESLQGHHGILAAKGGLKRLIMQAQLFGFHLAVLDFRDDARKINKAFSEMISAEPLTCTDLIKKLSQSQDKTKMHAESTEAKDITEQLTLFRTISDRGPSHVFQDYILSMTQSAEDMLRLLYLAKLKGLIHVSHKKVKFAKLHVVPLFETIEALQNAPAIMESLFTLPWYKSYLAAFDHVQEIMLGYSDSAKDGGYLTANWMLYDAQKKLDALGAKYGIRIKLFHGKGGTIDRGGGASHKAILAQPFAASQGLIKVTEQGEVISQKYSNPVIAQRNLEQLISAVVWTNLCSKKELSHNKKIPSWEDRARELSEISFSHYRKLITDTPGFLNFYYQATPIRVLQVSKIGSRPSRRAQGHSPSFSDLRAIPWVFSWIQSRYIISAWYGIGTALDTYIRSKGEEGLEHLREMYDKWPFFKSVLSNAQISLAKTDPYISEQYSLLVEDAQVRTLVHGLLHDEYQLAVERILQITQQKDLLDFNKTLKESIKARNPYVDPLNYIQLRFLSEFASEDFSTSTEEGQRIADLLLLTVNGIAFGMKSTG